MLLNFPGWIFHFHKVHSNDKSFSFNLSNPCYTFWEDLNWNILLGAEWLWQGKEDVGHVHSILNASWRKYSVDIQKAICTKESCNFPCRFTSQNFGKVFLYCSLRSQIAVIYHPLLKMTGKKLFNPFPLVLQITFLIFIAGPSALDSWDESQWDIKQCS